MSVVGISPSTQVIRTITVCLQSSFPTPILPRPVTPRTVYESASYIYDDTICSFEVIFMESTLVYRGLAPAPLARCTRVS